MANIYLTELIPKATWINGVKKLLQRNLVYCNEFPKNCGYCDEYDRINGDCWCTEPKTIVWSIFAGLPVWDNHNVGTYYYLDCIYKGGVLIKQGKTSNMHDWAGYPLIDNYCDDISFRKMLSENIAPCLIGTPDHMGCYIGEFTLGDGFIYNTHEMTPNGLISPRMASYVDENGYCYTHKGGAYVRRWARAGKMTGIINYDGEIMPTPQPSKKWSIDNVAVFIMRGSLPDGTEIPNGMDNRIAFFANYGYDAKEVRQAQDIVNKVYKRHDLDVLACDVAMRFISGEAGDGVTVRRQWVADHYPDEDADVLFRKAQDKVTYDYLGD